MSLTAAQPVLRILCSTAGAAALAPRLPGLGLPHACELVHPSPGPLRADTAFVSRDVTGESTKYDIKPDTAAFYDALRRAEGLRWVHIHSAGTDRPIYQELEARGIEISNSAGHNARVVAQSAVGGLLALARRLPMLMAAQRSATWIPLARQVPPRDLDGQRVLIVGWGAIGRHAAQVLSALGLRIRVARHDASRPAEGAEQTIGYADIRRVLPDTDWLLLACPLTDATLRLIDAEALALLPPHAHLLNVSRGTVVDETAMLDALRQGRLAGAYLDVFEYEPLPPDSPLWRMENVIATPHSAGLSDGNPGRVLEMFLDELKKRAGR